jgi:rubrerythrin
MWKAVLDLAQVFAVAICAGLFTAALYWLVIVGKNIIRWATEFEDDFEDEVKVENCEHKRYRYTESHPDKVWTCNDCGENF